MSDSTYLQRNRGVMLNRAKDYYEDDKERIKMWCGICGVIIWITIGLKIFKSLKEYKNHIKVSKIKNVFILIILFWVKEVVKKEVLWEWGFGFSLGFWGTFFGCFLSASNCAILRIKNTLKKKKKREFRP